MQMRLGVAVSLMVAAACAIGQTNVIHVAPDRRDVWSGGPARPNKARTDGPVGAIHELPLPVTSLERARDLARRKGPAASRIVLQPGVFRLARTLVLDERDSGLTVTAARRGTTTIVGSREVRGWRRVGPGLCSADLSRQGFRDYRFRELFLRGARQVLARHPNRDPKSPLTGGMLYVAATAPKERTSFHYRAGDVPWERWGDRSQAEVNLYPYNCWDHNIIRIADVDSETRTATLRYPVAGSIQIGNRYFIQNVRGALDAPGEWFCDRRTGVLWFRPPDGRIPRDGDVTVPMVENLIELSGKPGAPIRDVRIEGLRLSQARMDAIALEGAENCTVSGCTIGGVGGVGVNVGYLRNATRGIGLPWSKAGAVTVPYHSGDRALQFSHPCSGCRVVGNDIAGVGGDAIALRGSGNRADNNRLSQCGLYDMVCAAVTVCGEENVVSRNTIHDTPRDGVFVNGGRNAIEYNDIRRTMMNTADNAAIALRQHNPDLAMAARGNVIRFNRIRDVIGYGCYPHCTHPGEGYAAPFCGFGIYLDSYITGVTVYGNLIARCGGPNLFIQFGGDNVVENNIIVQGGADRLQFDSLVFFGTFLHGEAAAKYRSSVGPNVFRHNLFVDPSPNGVLYKVGHWDAATRSDPAQARLESNLVWRAGKPVRVVMHPSEECRSWEEWQARGNDRDSAVADPLFVNADADDYRLMPASPATGVGYRDIASELARSGVYASPERATWPVVVAGAGSERHRTWRFGKSATALIDGFETTDPGARPRGWQVAAELPAYAQVSVGPARTGSRSLKIVDAAGLQKPWEPHLYLNPNLPAGRARFEASFCNDPAEPADYYVEMRDWSGPLLVGPTFRVDREGMLWAGGRMGSGGAQVCTVPHGRWVTIAMEVILGDKPPTEWQLTVEVAGQAARRVTLPIPDAAFRHITWLGISSTSTERSVLLVDDLALGIAGSRDLADWRSNVAVRGTRSRPVVNAEPRGAGRLIADWPLNDAGFVLRDVSGNGLHGSQGGAGRATGSFGHALRTGPGGYASFGDPPALRLGAEDFTLECWVMPETLEVPSEHKRRRILEKTAYPASSWVMDVRSDGKLYLEMIDSGRRFAAATSEGAIRAGRWSHVVISVGRRRGQVEFMVDGRRAGQVALPHDFVGSLDVEGTHVQTGAWQPFAGLIAGVRVYRSALSEAQAAARWDATRRRFVSPVFRDLGDD